MAPATEEEDEAYLDLYPYKPPFVPEDVENRKITTPDMKKGSHV